jgi:putative transposase
MSRYTPRLGTFDYLGAYRYFWTICTFRRQRVFLHDAVVDSVLLDFLNAADGERIAISAYCFMPDHVHFLFEGTDGGGSPIKLVSRAKQASGFRYSRQHRIRLWQKTSWDRILRSDEDTPTVVRYILDNPVRAGLVERAIDYPFSGSATCGRDELFESIALFPAG